MGMPVAVCELSSSKRDSGQPTVSPEAFNVAVEMWAWGFAAERCSSARRKCCCGLVFRGQHSEV